MGESPARAPRDCHLSTRKSGHASAGNFYFVAATNIGAADTQRYGSARLHTLPFQIHVSAEVVCAEAPPNSTSSLRDLSNATLAPAPVPGLFAPVASVPPCHVTVGPPAI